MYIVAEIGTNWYPGTEANDFEQETIDNVVSAAKYADIVKLQLFTANTLYSRKRAPMQWERIKPYEFPLDTLPEIKQQLNNQGKKLWASVFDAEIAEKSVVHLDGLKIASGDFTNAKLVGRVIELCSQYSLPMALSTGAANTEEIARVLGAIDHDNDIPEIILFQCVSAYPANARDYNLRCMIKYVFQADSLGLSDHTDGYLTAQLALALQYKYFEKHYKPRYIWGLIEPEPPDWNVSFNPGQFQDWKNHLIMAKEILGDGDKKPMESELSERIWARRGKDGLRPNTEEQYED